MPLVCDSMELEKSEIVNQQFVALNFIAKHWLSTETSDDISVTKFQNAESSSTTKHQNLSRLAKLWNENMTRTDRLPGVVYELDMSKNLPEKLTHWTMFPCFKKHREDEKQFQEFVENRGHISGQENYESLTQCVKCGKRKVVSSAKQTRSSDEPMTVTHFCISCFRCWTG